jgi:protein ImuB
MRIAALWVPDFPLQALRRSTPELAEVPLAIATGPLPRDEVLCASAEAVELGARVGMTAAQARQMAPTVLVRVTPDVVAGAAGEALADAAGGFSPRIRRHAPGEVLLDVGGLVPRFGSAGRIAHELLRACRHVGLDARVGIAASIGVARVAARCGEVTVVASGEEGGFMAPLPLAALCAVLEPAPEIAVMLERWGLATGGALARLPRREVALRLGSQGTALHRLACGEETATFIPDPLRELLREGIEVDDPVGALEPFLFLTSGLLARLERRLQLRGEGFAEVLLELHLEGGGHREYRLKLVAPSREVPAVLALVRLQLEANPPGAPVERVTALVTPGRVRLTQGSLFGAPLPAPGKLSTALVRLASLVGPDRVGSPGVPDTHRPGAWTLAPFVLEDRGPGTGPWAPNDRAPGTGHRAPNDRAPGTGLRAPQDTYGNRNKEPRGCGISGPGARSPDPGISEPGARNPEPSVSDPGALCPVLRAFRPPRQAEVVAVDGRPVVARVGERGGQVVGCAGPYRFVGEWWGDQPYAREEFDVATADGSLMRVYFDRLEHRWFADGLYD